MSSLNKKIENLNEHILGNRKLKTELDKKIDQERDINKKLFHLILEKYGFKTFVTDLAIITNTWTLESESDNDTHPLGLARIGDTNVLLDFLGSIKRIDADTSVDIKNYAIRPFVDDKRLYQIALRRKRIDERGFLVCSLGEYPQVVASKKVIKKVNSLLKNGEYTETGILYKIHPYKNSFKEIGFYIDGVFRKFICVPECTYQSNTKLSNSTYVKKGESVLIEVTPVEWFIDTETETLISKYALIGNVSEEDISEFYSHLLKTIFAHLDSYESEKVIDSSSESREDTKIIGTEKLLSAVKDELSRLFDSEMDQLQDEIHKEGRILHGVMRFEGLIKK